MSNQKHQQETEQRKPKKPYRPPTCPCGFVGGSRNIRQHRQNCMIWNEQFSAILKEGKEQ